ARARARALPALPLLLLLLAPIGSLLAPEAIDRPATAPYGRDVLSRLLSGGAAKALGISAGP
ncbi:right-handed parallel beta-helix repeat-containing protein, partial [Streptomyces sp. NPDC056540]